MTAIFLFLRMRLIIHQLHGKHCNDLQHYGIGYGLAAPSKLSTKKQQKLPDGNMPVHYQHITCTLNNVILSILQCLLLQSMSMTPYITKRLLAGRLKASWWLLCTTSANYGIWIFDNFHWISTFVVPVKRVISTFMVYLITLQTSLEYFKHSQGPIWYINLLLKHLSSSWVCCALIVRRL